MQPACSGVPQHLRVGATQTCAGAQVRRCAGVQVRHGRQACGSVDFLSFATVTPICVASRSGRVHGCRRGGQEWTRARLTVGGRRGALSTHSRRGPQRRGGGAGRAEVTMVDSRLSSTRWSSGLSRALASSRRSLSCVTSRSPRYSVGGIPSRSDDAPSHATTPASWVKSTCLSAGAAEELEAAPPLEPSPLPIHCLMSPPCDLTLAFGPRIGGARSRNTGGNSRATLATACAPTPSAPNLVGVDIQQTAAGNK